ncbi:putative orphan protein [Pseudoalteromonas translucida]|uniref:Orphan protein n=1 Tax=Pseudoalteromonas translucida (strain TAC 125) TaxID=326442 RepID=Q3IC54_PSET1|nr:putative orphan protein [Pseudoalteromonas translucida]
MFALQHPQYKYSYIKYVTKSDDQSAMRKTKLKIKLDIRQRLLLKYVASG